MLMLIFFGFLRPKCLSEDTRIGVFRLHCDGNSKWTEVEVVTERLLYQMVKNTGVVMGNMELSSYSYFLWYIYIYIPKVNGYHFL